MAVSDGAAEAVKELARARARTSPTAPYRGWGSRPICFELLWAALPLVVALGSFAWAFSHAASDPNMAGSALTNSGRPCNIPRIPANEMSWERFAEEFWNKKTFILVQGLWYNSRHRGTTERANMLRRWGTEMISLGTANTYTGKSVVKRKLASYLDYMATEQPGERSGVDSWYLFGDNEENFWGDVLADYQAPIFSDPAHPSPPRPESLHARTLAFGMGGRNSGVPFHTHGPGWSEVVHGAKQWFLVPQEYRHEGHSHSAPRSSHFSAFDPNASMLQWITSANYTSFGKEGTPTEGYELYECVIRPGEQLYFPTQWYHATLNLAPYTVFISAFT